MTLTESLASTARSSGVEKLVVGAVIHSDGSALVVTRSDADDFLAGVDDLYAGDAQGARRLVPVAVS